MAIFKGEGNSIRVTGRVVGTVKTSKVGANETPLARFGCKCGEGREGEIMNVKAWRNLAEFAETLQNGDAVDVSGYLETREYDSKTFTDLVADYINVSRAIPAQPIVDADGFTDLDSSDIPF